MTELTDIALLERIALRNMDALAGIYYRYGRVAFARAYRVVGEASAAEEMVQDAFETVWSQGHVFDASKCGNVRGWLLDLAAVINRQLDRGGAVARSLTDLLACKR